MCQACDEMQLYYAYLDAIEEAKRKAQPWECQVTVFPQDDDAGKPAAAATASSVQRGLVCDEPE
jgi:hypothetical protein